MEGAIGIENHRKPRTFNMEQKKLKYTVERQEGVEMAQLRPYCDKISEEVKLDSLKYLIMILDIAFRDEDKTVTAKRELLKFKQQDCEFSQYYAKFQ
jgi:hypothetical protein